jgi:hypothetical protein
VSTKAQYLAEIRKMVRFWQPRLRLQQWHITARFANEDEMQEEAWSWTLIDALHLRAEFVYHPLTPPGVYLYTTVHELLHLLFDPGHTLKRALPKPARKLVLAQHHRAIDMVARALTGAPPDILDDGMLEAPPWTTPSPK